MAGSVVWQQIGALEARQIIQDDTSKARVRLPDWRRKIEGRRLVGGPLLEILASERDDESPVFFCFAAAIFMMILL